MEHADPNKTHKVNSGEFILSVKEQSYFACQQWTRRIDVTGEIDKIVDIMLEPLVEVTKNGKPIDKREFVYNLKNATSIKDYVRLVQSVNYLGEDEEKKSVSSLEPALTATTGSVE